MADEKEKGASARQRRMAAREALRDKLKGEEYLQQIENDYAELTLLSACIDAATATPENPYAVDQATKKATARANIIKIKMDTNFKRLNKVLPDLKQVEIGAGIEDEDYVLPVQVVIKTVDASNAD